jgi:hypothetical protein
MNSEMQKLTEQGINENKLMKTLTHQSAQDTRSMMVVALISAIFLPATFLAVSYQMLLREQDADVSVDSIWIQLFCLRAR